MFTETFTCHFFIYFPFPLLSGFSLITGREKRLSINKLFAPADRDSATLGSARHQMGRRWPQPTPNTSSLSHLTRTYYKENGKRLKHESNSGRLKQVVSIRAPSENARFCVSIIAILYGEKQLRRKCFIRVTHLVHGEAIIKPCFQQTQRA